MESKKFDLKELLSRQASRSSYGTPVRNTYQDYSPGDVYNNTPMTKSYQQNKFEPQTAIRINTESKAEAEDRIAFIEQSISSMAKKFTMSKSESQKLLLSLREEIKMEENIVNQQVDGALKVIFERFRDVQERTRKELLQMMEWAFAQNQRVLKEEMVRIGKAESPDFKAVYRQIQLMDQQIVRLLNSLNGVEYRRTIAQVVTRDFQSEMGALRKMVRSAKESYFQSLGQIVRDQSKFELTHDNLNKLFYINRRTSQRAKLEVVEEKKPVKKGCCG